MDPTIRAQKLDKLLEIEGFKDVTELAEAVRLLREKGIEPLIHEPAGDPAGTIEKIAEWIR